MSQSLLDGQIEVTPHLGMPGLLPLASLCLTEHLPAPFAATFPLPPDSPFPLIGYFRVTASVYSLTPFISTFLLSLTLSASSTA